jgi:two-component system cell cycle sensor histidine kinase PleC
MTNVRRATAGDERPYAKFSDFSVWSEQLSSNLIGLVHGSPRQLPQVETTLKRLIPILITAFLVVVAASRTLGIMAEYNRMDDAARQSTALIAITSRSVLSENAAPLSFQNRPQAEQKLSAAFPEGSMGGDTFVLLSDASGKVFATSSVASSIYIGTSLKNLLP